MKTLLSLLLLNFPGEVWAQSGEMWLSGGASIFSHRDIGSPFSDGAPDDVQLDHGFRVGFRFAYNSAGHIGHEIQYAYNRSVFNDGTGTILPDVGSAGTAIHQGGYNVLYYLDATNDGAKARPFATVGVHLSDLVLPGAAVVQASSVKFGINYGGGIKFKLSPLFGVRIDIRGYDTGKPNWNHLLVKQSGILHQTEASIGFGFYF
jgi:opacity protein-like surface antigen